MASFKHSVQLILYPQVYDGYHEYLTSSTTSGGTNPTNTGKPPVLEPYQVPILGTEILGNATFNKPSFGTTTNIGAPTGDHLASNSVALRTAPAPIGQWRLSYTNNLVGNEPSIIGGKLNLTTSPTQGSTSVAYTTVSNLQAGNSYRVLITIDSAPAGTLQIGATGERGSWEQPSKENNLARVGQLGGTNGMIQGKDDFIKASNGMNYGAPLRQAISTPTRFYQNFVASSNAEVLQISYSSNSSTPAIINEVSVLATNTDYPVNSGNDLQDFGGSVTQTNASYTKTTFLDDGQVILDLYKDQTIPLNLSVDEFTKVDEKIASYSKSFMIPATKHNNKIFSFYFDVTRTQNRDVFFFNPFAKTRAKVKEDTVLIFEGWLRLINVQIKNGEISYNINLYSEPTTFCDYLKAAKLGDIDMSELGHEYDVASIEDSWDDTIGLPLTNPLNVNSKAYDAAIGASNTNVLKYPFINWAGSFTLLDPDTVFCGIKEMVFRPVIQCKYLLDKMFEATPFTYKSNFLNSTYFKNLYMDYNYSGELAMMYINFQMKNELEFGASNTGGNWTDLVYPLLVSENPSGASVQHYNSLDGKFTMQYDGHLYCGGQMRFYRDWFNLQGDVRLVLDQTPNGGVVSYPNTDPIKWYDSNWTAGSANCGALDGTNAPILLADEAQCGAGRTPNLYTTLMNLQAGDQVFFQFRKTGGNAAGTIWQSTNAQVTEWNHDYLEGLYNDSELNKINFIVLGGESTMAFLQQGLRAQLNQYEFWNGIKTMFNLVTMPDKTTENALLIEPYYDVFLGNPKTKQLDWTEKVDASNIKIEPLNKIPKTTHFSYVKDDDDFRATQYFNATGGYLYGTKTYTAPDQFFSLLAGEKKIEAKPFAPTIAAPLTMLFPDFICSHIYASTDEGYSSFENKPRILYNEGIFNTPQAISGNQMAYGTTNFGWFLNTHTEYLRMTHLSLIPTSSATDDLNFGECPLVQPLGSSPINNLFNQYWKPYYDQLYNPDAKIVKLKMKLTPKELAEFEFYDTVLVKNREYRVNKIQYNSGLLASVELILIT